MARKKVGVVELRWTCPKCSTLNSGSTRLCQSCGAPQPDNVKFELPERQELITDAAVQAKAAAGADIHCPYCGTRNPAGSKVCSQCQGDISEGALRKAGEVLGAFKTGPAGEIACPRCGTANPDTATTCRQCGSSLAREKTPEKPAAPTPAAKPTPWLAVALAGIAVVVCGALVLLAIITARTKEITGTVQGVSWERSIPIEGLVPVEHQDWADQIPTDAELGGCEQKVRSVEQEPAPNSVEVCGTPYSVDTGSGYANVVQDCEYHVYDDYCSYSVIEWKQVDVMSLSGSDYAATWPDPVLAQDKRLGTERSETYTIVFSAGGETYSFETDDFDLFLQAQTGTTWKLNVNTFGNVSSIEP